MFIQPCCSFGSNLPVSSIDYDYRCGLTDDYFSRYPLLNFSPLPGKIPTKIVLPYNFHIASISKNYTLFDDKKNENEQELKTDPLPRWTSNPPFVYCQQIVLRAVTLPYNNNNVITDAFRGPLFEVFKLLELTRNHETNETTLGDKISLDKICYRIENAKRSGSEVLFPEYNCLVLSPANLWRQNIHNFNKDNLLKTIFQHHVTMIILFYSNGNNCFILVFRIIKKPEYQILKCFLDCLYQIPELNDILCKIDHE